MRLFIRICTIFACLTSSVPAIGESANYWPQISEVTEEYNFIDANNANVVLGVYSEDKTKLYDFQCHPGDYVGDPLFDYSGFFHCRLIPLYSENKLDSVLADSFTEVKEWENRGRFLPSHLFHGRENYKDWGRRRQFNLRGMEITLSIMDELLGKLENGLSFVKSFRFVVSFKNKPSTVRAISEPPQTPRPEWFYSWE